MRLPTHDYWPASLPRILVTFTGAVACSMAGVITTLTSSDVRLWFVSLSLALFPVVFIASLTSDVALGFILIFSQNFEIFEVSAIFFTFSIGVLVLMTFLALRLTSVKQALLGTPTMRFMSISLLVFILAHLLGLLHEDFPTTARSMVTVLSFAAFWTAGALLASESGIKGLAYGAALVIIFLGLLGLASYLELLPVPFETIPPRPLLGIWPPLPRIAPLGIKTLGVILPLAVPWFVWRFVRTDSTDDRIQNSVILLSLFLISALIFQARVMILEVAIPCVAAFGLFRPSISKTVTLVAGCIVAGILVGPQLIQADEISSDLRSESYTLAIDLIKENPPILLEGSNQSTTLQYIQDNSKYGFLVPDAPLHNLFLMETLSFGLSASIPLLILFAVPMKRGLQHIHRGQPSNPDAVLIILIGITALLPVMLFPLISNVGGLWLSLGLIAKLSSDLVLQEEVYPATNNALVPYVHSGARGKLLNV